MTTKTFLGFFTLQYFLYVVSRDETVTAVYEYEESFYIEFVEKRGASGKNRYKTRLQKTVGIFNHVGSIFCSPYKYQTLKVTDRSQ